MILWQTPKHFKRGQKMTKNELIIKVLNMIDYFQYHNKNLTKEQWQKISELYHFILEQNKK